MNGFPTTARRGWLALALLIAPVAVARAQTPCSQQPVRAAHVEVLGLDMLINGVPTSVYGMSFDGAPDEVVSEFRAFWKRAGVPANGQRSRSGLLLSALDRDCHYVLMLAASAPGAQAQHSRGVLSIARLNGAARHAIPNAAVALPDGARTVTDIESRDPGQAGRTWIIELSGDAPANARRYRSQLADDGWTTVAESPAYRLDGSQRIVGGALAMQRGSDRLDAVFSDRDGRTEGVIHATRSP
jgi:hypothetical protein